MQTFQSLSYGDKWRVTRLLTRGEAPDDPCRAAAVVELAESYQHRGRVYATFARWLPVATAVLLAAIAIPAAVEGDVPMAIVCALIVLGSLGHLVLNPAVWPKNVARSLEASRRVTSGG